MALRLLVVDDDPQVLKLFSQLLTKGGYEVRTESSSEKALEAVAQSSPFDLVVLDLSMPAPDGFEVLKALRTLRPGMRVLVVSGYLGGALLEAAELLGATATLNKINAPRMLLSTVSQLLGQ
jgi:CheY-like chemotaxis protein